MSQSSGTSYHKCHLDIGIVVPSFLLGVMVERAPTSFSPFSLVDCMLLFHFSFNDFITVAFLDLAGDLDIQI